MKHTFLARLVLAAQLPVAALAADTPANPVDEIDDVRYVVGVTAVNGPIYWGQTERQTGLRPFLAVKWGRFRISNSGAGGLIGESNAGGASTDLLRTENLRLRAGLRIDRGRKIDGDSTNRLEDLPRVRGTVRARLTATHRLSDTAAWNIGLNTDVLNREGGKVVQLGVSERLRTPEWLQGLGGQWSVSAGVAGGDATYMRSYFGVAPGARRFAAYEPGAGLRNVNVGLGWQHHLGGKQQWVVFGGIGAQRLLGPAADAPFVQRLGSVTADFGLAYRH
jgi:MipA family protein